MVLVHVLDGAGFRLCVEGIGAQKIVSLNPVNFSESTDKTRPVQLQEIEIKVVGFMVIPRLGKKPVITRRRVVIFRGQGHGLPQISDAAILLAVIRRPFP